MSEQKEQFVLLLATMEEKKILMLCPKLLIFSLFL